MNHSLLLGCGFSLHEGHDFMDVEEEEEEKEEEQQESNFPLNAVDPFCPSFDHKANRATTSVPFDSFCYDECDEKENVEASAYLKNRKNPGRVMQDEELNSISALLFPSTVPTVHSSEMAFFR